MNLLAQSIKESLDIQRVMEHYGVEFNRAGFAICPFHAEKTASITVKNGFFKCFGCGKGGDVITFASLQFGISPSQAMLKLNDDFHLGLCGKRPDRRTISLLAEKRRIEREKREEFEKTYIYMERIYRILWYAFINFRPKSPESPIHGLFAQACRELPYYEWWFETHPWKDVTEVKRD